MTIFKRLFITISILLLASGANAGLKSNTNEEQASVQFLIGYGYGYTRPSYKTLPTEGEPSVALAVYTDNFYLDVHKISYGFELQDNLSLTIYGGQDDLPSPEDLDPAYGIKSGDSFDVGLELSKSINNKYIAAAIQTDVTGTHGGLGVHLSTGYARTIGKSELGLDFSLFLLDRNYSNYYYGVSTNESSPSIPAFRTGAAITGYVGAYYGYSLTDNLTLRAFLDISPLSASVRNSPRIQDNDFLGEIDVNLFLTWNFSVYDF